MAIVSPAFHETPGGASERRRIGGCAVLELEPERESVCHRSPFRVRLGPNGAGTTISDDGPALAAVVVGVVERSDVGLQELAADALHSVDHFLEVACRVVNLGLEIRRADTRLKLFYPTVELSDNVLN
jgi:hypothetical protein